MSANSFAWQISPCTGREAGSSFQILAYYGCPETLPTATSGDFSVTPTAAVAADLNGDCHVDQFDVDLFNACATAPTLFYDAGNLPPACTLIPDDFGVIAADFDLDGDVDQDDFGKLQRCNSGPNAFPAPGCN